MARLWDILDAARTAISFVADLHYEDFINDRKTRNAVERNLEIIGEAARGLSLRKREELANIPWKSMIGLRNVLAHEYGDIRHEVLWTVVTDKLPQIVQSLVEAGADQPPLES